jgi:predicted nucleotide-binding protein (sugar kinase/HSP70/actin superfamily)
MMRDVLRDNGYKADVSTFSAIFKGGLFALPDFARQFAPDVTWGDIIREMRLALSKMSILDEIERRVQYIRPREIDQGSVDKIWEEAIARVDGVTVYDDLDSVKQDVIQKLNRVQIDPELRPVKIAITGEYYAILDPFFNLDLERDVGRLGAEVHRTLMMSDWMKATMILEALGYPRSPQIARAAKQYLRWDISGEAWKTIGQTVIHAEKGFDGVIETMPFTCLPEISALNILPRVSREHNIPIATFIFDEQTGRAGMKTRLEAFVDLLYRRREVKESSRHVVPSKEFPVNEELCGTCALATRCWHTMGARECVLDGVENIF